MANLTKKQVSDLSKPGRYGDGNGLYLVVSPGGSKRLGLNVSGLVQASERTRASAVWARCP